MSFGKLYGFQGNARTTVLLAVARVNKLDIELVETNPDYPLSPEYLKLNPMGLIPTFEGPSGWVLTEAIAIAVYFASQDKDTSLLGTSGEDYAQILRWMSFVNSDVQPHLANWFKPLVGRRAYNHEKVEIAARTTNRAIAVINAHLSSKTYFLGEALTLADLFAASSLSRGFSYVFDSPWQKEQPHVTRWFVNIVSQPVWKAVVPNPVIVEEAVKYHG